MLRSASRKILFRDSRTERSTKINDESGPRESSPFLPFLPPFFPPFFPFLPILFFWYFSTKLKTKFWKIFHQQSRIFFRQYFTLIGESRKKSKTQKRKSVKNNLFFWFTVKKMKVLNPCFRCITPLMNEPFISAQHQHFINEWLMTSFDSIWPKIGHKWEFANISSHISYKPYDELDHQMKHIKYVIYSITISSKSKSTISAFFERQSPWLISSIGRSERRRKR